MKKLKQIVCTALLFGCAVSCKDTSPCIKDQCCMSVGEWKLVKTLSRNRAYMLQGAIFIEGVEQTKGGSFPVCPDASDKLKGIIDSYNTSNLPYIYNYYVYGKLLDCTDCRTVSKNKSWFLNIEKIEKIN
jgi:hypothetical protein